MKSTRYRATVLAALICLTSTLRAAEGDPVPRRGVQWRTVEYRVDPSILSKFFAQHAKQPALFPDGATVTHATNPERLIMRITQEGDNAMQALIRDSLNSDTKADNQPK